MTEERDVERSPTSAKPKVALLVSDVDGTLVDKQKQLTPATIAAVKRLHDAGVPIALISARPMSGIRPLLDTLALDDVAAAFNGGILFRRDGTILAQHRIDADVARGVVDLARDAPVDVWLFADDRWYATDPDGPHTGSERLASAQEPVATDDLTPLLDRADKITFVSDDEATLRSLTATCQQAFGARATIVQSQTYYLDVTAPLANKGDGIQALAKAHGVPLDRIAAIGDQANDLPMLARAGLSIAMGNAPDAIRAKAMHVTLANDHDGVARAIDTLILGDH
jgi:Cof subfamily protein (haloacid dehalogenase superfamily)